MSSKKRNSLQLLLTRMKRCVIVFCEFIHQLLTPGAKNSRLNQNKKAHFLDILPGMLENSYNNVKATTPFSKIVFMFSNDILLTRQKHLLLFTSKKCLSRKIIRWFTIFLTIFFLKEIFIFFSRLHNWKLTTTLLRKDLEIRAVENERKSECFFFLLCSLTSLSSSHQWSLKGIYWRNVNPLI